MKCKILLPVVFPAAFATLNHIASTDCELFMLGEISMKCSSSLGYDVHDYIFFECSKVLPFGILDITRAMGQLSEGEFALRYLMFEHELLLC